MTKSTLFNSLPPEVQEKLDQLRQRAPVSSNGDKSTVTAAGDATGKKENTGKDWRAHLKTIRTVQQWLQEKWPHVFDIKNPKPLKRHIEQDIIPHLQEPLSRTQLRKGLQAYTNRIDYLQSILKFEARFNLEGEKVEDIPEGQIEFTRQKLTLKMQKSQASRNRTGNTGQNTRKPFIKQ